MAQTQLHGEEGERAIDLIDGPEIGIRFDNTFAREMIGAYVPWMPRVFPKASLLIVNSALAKSLQLDHEKLTSSTGVDVLAGSAVPRGAAPLAQAYAGHQFGGFSPRLGDGRAVLIGETRDCNGARIDIALKGSGRTPYSRGGDGLAAVGPMLREYMVSEAMHHLGIPSTRSLAVVATNEPVRRETMLPGAVLTRVAASHLRVGTFQYFAARQEIDVLKRLLDYAIARHDPELARAQNPALAFLEAVSNRQAKLIAQWMSVGFIHGVMNTDNMTVSGETIDFGPCAFMEMTHPAAVFSSIDHHGRYAYQNQPNIAQWNLARFAEALLPLIDDNTDRAVAQATERINAFPAQYEQCWQRAFAAKLGFVLEKDMHVAAPLARELLVLMEAHQVDFTLGFRKLSALLLAHGTEIRSLHAKNELAFVEWSQKWSAALASAGIAPSDAVTSMNAVNPSVIARNHRVEEALADANERGDLTKAHLLIDALSKPFDERSAEDALTLPASGEYTRVYQTFCGT